MRGDGFTCERLRNFRDALETMGGAMNGLRFVPRINSRGGTQNPSYDQWLGVPHPTVFVDLLDARQAPVYALGVRGPNNMGVTASAWHADRRVALRAARKASVKADRRQRRKRVLKKLSARGGRRRFVTPAFVRRLNAAEVI